MEMPRSRGPLPCLKETPGLSCSSTQRQSICEMPRYHAVLSDIRLFDAQRPTGWLGREDSNLCIRNLCPAGFTGVVPCGEGRSCTRLLRVRAHDLLPLFAPHDSGSPNPARRHGAISRPVSERAGEPHPRRWQRPPRRSAHRCRGAPSRSARCLRPAAAGRCRGASRGTPSHTRPPAGGAYRHAGALVREDAGFHAYQILEAGVRQFEGMGQEQQGAQTPTCRPPCSGVGTALFRPPCYHPNAVRE